MNKAQLETILARHGLAIDGTRGYVGAFRDLEIGVGKPRESLIAAKTELRLAGIAQQTCGCRIARVNNPEHPQHGQPYLEIESFWLE